MFEDYYGLSGRPFQLTPDPAFFFQSGTHRKALSYLGYGLSQGEGFIVITGEVGSGKSTIVAHLVATIDPAQLTIGQVVTSKLDGEEIIHVVAHSFGLGVEGHDKASALGAIESFLHDEARAGRRCLLVVDESQNLTVEALEELRMLSNFQLGSYPLLQTLLLGQPEFRETLQTHQNLEQLRQRVIAAHHLEAMEPAEIEPYVMHRLRLVDWQGNPAFDQRVFAELYTASRGIPRRINQILTRLLLLGAVEQRTRIDAAMLGAVLAEMAQDNAFPEAAPAPMPKTAPAPEPIKPLRHSYYQSQPEPEPAPEPEPYEPEWRDVTSGGEESPLPALDPELVDSLLAERDIQIAELQQAVVELSRARDEADAQAANPDIQVLQDRVAQLEAELVEQQRTLRHTLAMLIEWIEGDGSQKAA